MSLTAAIGYVIGLFIFAIFMRRYRKRMINKQLHPTETERTQSEKGLEND